MTRQRAALTGFTLLIVVLLFTSSMAVRSPSDDADLPFYRESEKLHSMATTSAADLERVYDYLNYRWPPDTNIPPIALEYLPKDFAELPDPTDRKHLFLRAILPIVLLENRRLREQRSLAELLLDNLPPEDSEPRDWLKQLAKRYRVKGNLSKAKAQQELLRKLDEIPTALVLAQAAIESGWGTSRFALEGNSLFGQWTYKPQAGLAPSERDPDANHAVRAFTDLQGSVRAYLRNINMGHAYKDLRLARAQARAEGRSPSADELAMHLTRYSARGKDYVKEIRRMLASRDFASLHLIEDDPNPARLTAEKAATATNAPLVARGD